MTDTTRGVLVRHRGEPKPAKYRRHPEPHDEFYIEASEEAKREVRERKELWNHLRAR